MGILCGVSDKRCSSWTLAKLRKTTALQGSCPRFLFSKQNKSIFWKHQRLLQGEIKVSNLCLAGAKPASSSSGAGEGQRLEGKRTWLWRKASLRQRKNQMATHRNNKKKNPKGSFRSLLMTHASSIIHQKWFKTSLLARATLPHLWNSCASCPTERPPWCGPRAPALLLPPLQHQPLQNQNNPGKKPSLPAL